MDFCMAGRTKRHQVPIAVVTAFCQWLDVMHLLRLGKSAFLQTLLTKRVCMHVSVTDALPGTSVPALGGWVPVVFLIVFGLQLLVLLTKPPVRQPWAAWVGTGALRFPWHRITSLGHTKSPAGFLPQGFICIFAFRYYNNSIGSRYHSMALSITLPNRVTNIQCLVVELI